MRRGLAPVIAAIVVQTVCLVAAARAQDEGLPCEAFAQNADGSWTATQSLFIPSANFSVRKGGILRRGEVFKGYDLAAKLDEVCRSAAPASALPAATASPAAAAPTQQPPPPLSTFADANGNIDVARLTCGHLAGASNEEATLFLAWYGGAYAGPAKARAINLARLRYAIRHTIDYCKANRDKPLVRAMELMLK
jgi:hypothetical protein